MAASRTTPGAGAAGTADAHLTLAASHLSAPIRVDRQARCLGRPSHRGKRRRGKRRAGRHRAGSHRAGSGRAGSHRAGS
ncbi:MAG TPA: hypothetical protein VF979_04995, partial [Streptosporangiaceae bacterium]